MGCNSTKNTSNNQNKEINRKDQRSSTMIKRQETKKPEIKKGKTFYIAQKNDNISDEKDKCKQKIELFVSLNNVKSETEQYQAKAYINNSQQSQNFIKILETNFQEIVEEHIPFSITAVLDYFFEKTQTLRIQIYDSTNKLIEQKELTLGRLMGSRNHFVIPCEDFEIVLDAKNAEGFDIVYSFNLKASSKVAYSSLYFIFSNFNDGMNFRKVYKSEERSVKDNFINYEKLELDGNSVNNGQINKNILFELYDDYKGLVGKVESSISSLLENNTLIVPHLEDSTYITLQVDVKESKNFRFVDLLQMGLTINLYIGIDFTMSNGDPSLSSSLHYIKGSQPNQYERAIKDCGSICAFYDDDQKFPCFGFGGIPKGSNTVNFCFNLNFQDDYEIQYIDNVLLCYRQSLSLVQLYGPTNFQPLIKKVNDCVRTSLYSNPFSYAILMIITDGQISDMEDTIEEIVESSKLPISIVIVGVGSADFANMDILDGDEVPLAKKNGEVRERDNVQFVEFKKFEGDFEKLSEAVLQEVPRQTQEYYVKHREAIDIYNRNNIKEMNNINVKYPITMDNKNNSNNMNNYSNMNIMSNMNNMNNINNINNNMINQYPVSSLPSNQSLSNTNRINNQIPGYYSDINIGFQDVNNFYPGSQFKNEPDNFNNLN